MKDEQQILSTSNPEDLKILKLWCLLELSFETSWRSNSWKKYNGSFTRALQLIDENAISHNIRARLCKPE